MNNPNLAWFLACICCLLNGAAWKDMEDFSDIFLTGLASLLAWATAYATISYILL